MQRVVGLAVGRRRRWWWKSCWWRSSPSTNTTFHHHPGCQAHCSRSLSLELQRYSYCYYLPPPSVKFLFWISMTQKSFFICSSCTAVVGGAIVHAAEVAVDVVWLGRGGRFWPVGKENKKNLSLISFHPSVDINCGDRLLILSVVIEIFLADWLIGLLMSLLLNHR